MGGQQGGSQGAAGVRRHCSGLGHTHPEPCRPTLVCRLSCTPKPGSSLSDTLGSVSSSIFSLGWGEALLTQTPRPTPAGPGPARRARREGLGQFLHLLAAVLLCDVGGTSRGEG